MDLAEAIEDLQTGITHYKLIVVNQDSKDLINECKSLDLDGMVKINVTKLLTENLLVDKTPEEKEYDTWDLMKTYLNSMDFKIFVLFDVEYMFSPELGNLDVINILEYYSRNGCIIILFIKAKLIDNHLIYSKEGYCDYKVMDISNANVVGWDNEN